MPHDPLERLVRLEGDGAALLDRSSAAQAAAGTAVGRDRRGAVTVRVDHEGHLEAVELHQRWRAQISAESLGDAVTQAVRHACLARAEAWAEAFRQPTAVTSTARSRPPAGHLPEELNRLTSERQHTTEDASRALRELLALLHDFEQGIDELSARMTAVQSQEYAGSSSDDGVRVSVTAGGDVVAVEYGLRWLRDRQNGEIESRTVEAFAMAYRRAAEVAPERLTADSGLNAVRRVLNDPAELARRMRLAD